MHSLFDLFGRAGRLHNCAWIPCFLSLSTNFFKSIDFFVPPSVFIRALPFEALFLAVPFDPYNFAKLLHSLNPLRIPESDFER